MRGEPAEIAGIAGELGEVLRTAGSEENRVTVGEFQLRADGVGALRPETDLGILVGERSHVIRIAAHDGAELPDACHLVLAADREVDEHGAVVIARVATEVCFQRSEHTLQPRIAVDVDVELVAIAFIYKNKGCWSRPWTIPQEPLKLVSKGE